MSKIVIALGGNALGNTAAEQHTLTNEAAKSIVDLVCAGNEVIVVHGNGPQVGMIHRNMTLGAESEQSTGDMPFPECGSMSQGYIGFHLQNSIQNELQRRQLNTSAVSLVTQVLVDESDPAFDNPTKPIGSFYTKEAADELSRAKGFHMIEDSGRGYRQVVPSPKPLAIIEKDSISTLLSAGQIVIAVGGGGIPVVKKDGVLHGVPAVIDKDSASAKLAESLGADLLIILTAVDRVAINFGQPNQQLLESINLEEGRQYCEEGHFAPGSMLPKVEAAMSFVETGGKAIIASLEKAALALTGQTGTLIYKN